MGKSDRYIWSCGWFLTVTAGTLPPPILPTHMYSGLSLNVWSGNIFSHDTIVVFSCSQKWWRNTDRHFRGVGHHKEEEELHIWMDCTCKLFIKNSFYVRGSFIGAIIIIKFYMGRVLPSCTVRLLWGKNWYELITLQPLCIVDTCGGFIYLLSIMVHRTHADKISSSEGTCIKYSVFVVIQRICLGMLVGLKVMTYVRFRISESVITLCMQKKKIICSSKGTCTEYSVSVAMLMICLCMSVELN